MACHAGGWLVGSETCCLCPPEYTSKSTPQLRLPPPLLPLLLILLLLLLLLLLLPAPPTTSPMSCQYLSLSIQSPPSLLRHLTSAPTSSLAINRPEMHRLLVEGRAEGRRHEGAPNVAKMPGSGVLMEALRSNTKSLRKRRSRNLITIQPNSNGLQP